MRTALRIRADSASAHSTQKHMAQNTEESTRCEGSWVPGAPVLWGAAAVLAGLLIVQASRMGVGEARAEMVTRAGEFTVLTSESGSEEVLLVIDNRREQLLVYKVVNQSSLDHFARHDLARMFMDARLGAQGRK